MIIPKGADLSNGTHFYAMRFDHPGLPGLSIVEVNVALIPAEFCEGAVAAMREACTKYLTENGICNGEVTELPFHDTQKEKLQ